MNSWKEGRDNLNLAVHNIPTFTKNNTRGQLKSLKSTMTYEIELKHLGKGVK